MKIIVYQKTRKTKMAQTKQYETWSTQKYHWVGCVLTICGWAWGLPSYMATIHSETALGKINLSFVRGCQLKIAPGSLVCGNLGLTHSNNFYLQIHLPTISLFYLHKSLVSSWEINHFQYLGVCVLNLNYLYLKLFFFLHLPYKFRKLNFWSLEATSHVFLVNTYIMEKWTMNSQKKNLP